MAREVSIEDTRDFHLAGILLLIASVAAGVVVVLMALLAERENRIVHLSPAAPAAEQVAPAAAPAAQPAPAQAQAPAAAAPLAAAAGAAIGDVAAGKAAFVGCNGCHPNGKAGVGPSLTGLSSDALTQAVRQGKGMMPAYPAAQVSDQQLRDMIAFLQSVN